MIVAVVVEHQHCYEVEVDHSLLAFWEELAVLQVQDPEVVVVVVVKEVQMVEADEYYDCLRTMLAVVVRLLPHIAAVVAAAAEEGEARQLSRIAAAATADLAGEPVYTK